MLTDESGRLAPLLARNGPVRLLVTGGGTGGHTFTATAVANATRSFLAQAGIPCDILYVGSGSGLESSIAARHDIPFRAVAVGKLRRRPTWAETLANAGDLFRIVFGTIQATAIVARFKPDVVFSTGGYVGVPAAFAAGLCRRRLTIHEQTVRLGLANRLVVRLATRIAVSSATSVPLLPSRVRSRVAVTGTPIRSELLQGDAQAGISALDWHGWTPDLPTIYVTGGAQGSVQVNTLLRNLLPTLLARANVLHQCGSRWLPDLRRQADLELPATLRPRYCLIGFVGPELSNVLALADIVVSRSGAGTVAELTALGKPSVLIPLSSAAGDEQLHNAQYVADAGACVMLAGADATPERLEYALAGLVADPVARAHMADAARQLGRPYAADQVVRIVLDCLVSD